MITYQKGDMFEADVEALVNTVNTVGAMGKGLALLFKNKFPANNEMYVNGCRNNEVKTGEMFVVGVTGRGNLRYIVNFPTKEHWRYPSQMVWIEEGLIDLRRFIIDNNVKSIAIPALGAGLGGLNWPDVKSEIEDKLAGLDAVQIMVFEPL